MRLQIVALRVNVHVMHWQALYQFWTDLVPVVVVVVVVVIVVVKYDSGENNGSLPPAMT